MPNWCDNTLRIKGSAEQIQKVKAQLNAPYETYYTDHKDNTTKVEKYSNPVMSFWNICRPPEEHLDEYFGRNGFIDGEKKGDTKYNWYNFNNREWGTKWDIGNPDKNSWRETNIHEHSDTEVSYTFQTAWSPPEYAIEKLSAQYPDLEIELEWEEEQGFGAIWIYQDGEYSIEKEWDIPNSHADYVERDNVDGCACSHYDVDDWYSDCPGAKKVIEITCVKDVEVVKSAT